MWSKHLQQALAGSASRVTGKSRILSSHRKPLAGVALVAALSVLLAGWARADGPLVTTFGQSERNWSMVYNPQANEYLLGFSQTNGPAALVQRVGADGVPIGSPSAPWLGYPPGWIVPGEIQLAYNPHLNKYFAVAPALMWYVPLNMYLPVVMGVVLNPNLIIDGAPFPVFLFGTTSTYQNDANLKERHYRTVNAAFNLLANEYLVTAQTAYGPTGLIYSARISESGNVSSPNVVRDGYGWLGSHALAYGPVPSRETPTGRYLLVSAVGQVPHSTSAQGSVTMLGSTGEVVVAYIPFGWEFGYAWNPWMVYSPDVVYAHIPGGGYGERIFLVVWEDENNVDPWGGSAVGVWGSYIDATKLSYPTPDPDNGGFILAWSCWNTVPLSGWDPRVVYNEEERMFYLAVRQTPTNAPPGEVECLPILNYHISLLSFSGHELYPWKPPCIERVLSQMTGNYPGNELPRRPTLAVGQGGKLLVAWDDARNEIAGDKRDLYGTVTTTTTAYDFRITAITRENNNIRVTWTCGPGKTNVLQVTAGSGYGSYSNNFSDLTGLIILTNAPSVVTTNHLDVGGATNKPARYYRVKLVP